MKTNSTHQLLCVSFMAMFIFTSQSNVDPRDEVFSYHHQFDDKPSLSKAEDRKEYNIGVLRHLQVIFGHLAASRLQYYVPRGFWKQFRSVCVIVGVETSSFTVACANYFGSAIVSCSSTVSAF